MTSDHRFDVHNANHVASGDVIQQYGPGSVGKQVHTGPGDNVVSKPSPAGPVSPQTVIVHGGDYVAQDKTSSQFGNVSHDFRRRPDDPPGTETEHGSREQQREVVTAAGAAEDTELLEAARAVLGDRESSGGKYTVDARKAKGVMTGEFNVQNITLR